MSYLTYFWTSNSPEPGCLTFTDNCESTDCLVVGGWCVPIMWSTCFSGADVNVVLIPDTDWSEPDQPEYGASCDTTIASAVLRVEERLPSVLRILPEHTHEACNLFLCRLQESKAKYVHTEISLLLSNEEDPPTFKPYWAALLDGLDTPVMHIRQGLLQRILGLGLPHGWHYLCYWSVCNQSQKALRSRNLPLDQVVGASLDCLRSWQA